MKFSFLQENLSKGLQTIMHAIPAKSSLPILSNVLIETDKGRIKLSATNLETAITTYVGASIEEEGSITVPARLLKDFISNINLKDTSYNILNKLWFYKYFFVKFSAEDINPSYYGKGYKVCNGIFAGFVFG